MGKKMENEKMKITEPIQKALERAVKEAGNPSRFSSKLPGIKQTTIRNWLLGITTSISEDNWEKVYPLIKKWLITADSYRDLDNALICLKQIERKIDIFYEKNKDMNEFDMINNEEYDKILIEYEKKILTLREYISFYINQLLFSESFEKIIDLIKELPDIHSPYNERNVVYRYVKSSKFENTKDK